MNDPRKLPSSGVATTTPVAFVCGGVLYLERMSSISEDGAGILCTTVPATGEELPVAFNLSTAKETVRCRVRVEAPIPTTPAGLASAGRSADGRALSAAMGGTHGDSVTMMFRLSDLAQAPAGQPPPAKARPTVATGFCARFLDLEGPGRAAVMRHLQVSRRLSEAVAVRGGQVISLTEDDRRTLAAAFDDEGLSKKAMDW